MAQVLFITANPKPTEASVSLSMSEKFLKAYKKAKPEDEIVIMDLYKEDIPGLEEIMEVLGRLLMHLPLDGVPESTMQRFARYNQLTDQFIDADKYVFVTPLWNLGLPAVLKSYIDTVCVAGKTFKYSEKGVSPLLENKKCLHIHASGGFHSKDPMNHGEPYLRDIMSFIGVKDYRCLFVEGHGALPDQADAIIKQFAEQIPELAEWFAV